MKIDQSVVVLMGVFFVFPGVEDQEVHAGVVEGKVGLPVPGREIVGKAAGVPAPDFMVAADEKERAFFCEDLHAGIQESRKHLFHLHEIVEHIPVVDDEIDPRRILLSEHCLDVFDALVNIGHDAEGKSPSGPGGG